MQHGMLHHDIIAAAKPALPLCKPTMQQALRAKNMD
jgi:hypothetical protein